MDHHLTHTFQFRLFLLKLPFKFLYDLLLFVQLVTQVHGQISTHIGISRRGTPRIIASIVTSLCLDRNDLSHLAFGQLFGKFHDFILTVGGIFLNIFDCQFLNLTLFLGILERCDKAGDEESTRAITGPLSIEKEVILRFDLIISPNHGGDGIGAMDAERCEL